MSNITIPGPVANQLRQGLTLRMGEAAQALEEASLCDRRERTAETFAEHFEAIDAYRDVMLVLGWEHDEPEPMDVEIDLDGHREVLDGGLDETTAILTRFTEEGSPDDRRQAVIDLGEVEGFKASLPAAVA